MQNPSCKILDLSGHNGLNDINLLEQSMAIFARIAPTVESVNLSKRVLFLLGDRCEQLFSALPATVTHLMVEKHNKESGADFPKFFRHMPKTVTSLQINNFMDSVAEPASTCAVCSATLCVFLCCFCMHRLPVFLKKY